ncbi:MAG: WG repeat-containing protein, partial [Candidatus Brocadiia bacterium]
MRRLVAMVVCAAMVVSVGCSREPGHPAAPDATGGTCLIAPVGGGPDGTAVGVINTGGKFLVKPDYDFAEVAGNFIILQRFDRLGLAYRDGRIMAPCVNTWVQAGNVFISIEDSRWGCARRRAVAREAQGFAAGGVGASDGKDGSVFAFRQDGSPLVRSGFKPTGVVAGRFIIARRESGGKLRVFDAVGSDVCGREFDGESCVVYASDSARSPLLSVDGGEPASLHFMGRPFASAEDTDYWDKPEQDYDLPGGGIAPDDLPFVIVMTSGGKSLVYDRDFRRLSDREFDEVGLLGGGKVAVRIGSRWGFIDLARGADIPAMYGNVAFFSEGLCPVQVRLLANGDIDMREAWDSKGEAPGPLLWGYIDENGRFAITPRYHAAGEFSGGVAKVTLEEAGKADVELTIDRQGNPARDDASTARAGREISPGVTLSKDHVLTWQKKAEVETCDNIDEARVEPLSGLVLFRKGSAWGYAAPGTDEWDWAQYDSITLWSKSLLLAKGERGEKLLDFSGLEVVPDADRFGELSEGLAPFHNDSLVLWGYLDEQGRVAIIPFFDEAGSFSEGLAPAKRDDVWGFLNRKGEWAIAAEFEGARPFRQGLATVKKSGLWGAIGAEGREKIPFAFAKPLHFVGGLAAATVARPYGIMGSDGKAAVKPRFRTIPVWTDGIAVMAENGRFGAINPRGEYVIPAEYAELKYIGDGLLSYRVDLLSCDWGLISVTGAVICEPLLGVE